MVRDQHDWKEELEVAVALSPVSKVYAGMVHHGSGAFRGRGHLNGEPRMIRVLARRCFTTWKGSSARGRPCL